MTGYFCKLGWKNLWRNPRRTGLTMGAISLAVMSLICIHNYYDSFFDGVVRNAIRYHSGHFIVAGEGFSQAKLSGTFIKEPKTLLKYLNTHPGVEAASSRVLVTGLLSSPRGSASIAFHGIDPKNEKRVTHFHKNVVTGSFWDKKGAQKEKSPIVIGRGLARLLKVSVGQKVVALTQGVDGSVGNELFRVTGIFETESELDNKLAFIPIQNARSLLSLPKNAVHYVSVIIKDDEALNAITADTARAFPRAVEIKSWRDLQKHLTALIELNKTANNIVMCVLILVAAFGIANTVLMSVLERTREFGVMSALGTFQRELISLVFVETLMLSGVGTGLGALLGAAVTTYFGRTGFDLAWLTDQPLVVNGAIVQTVSYPSVQWENVFIVCSIVVTLSLIASLVPAKFIAELKAAKALRAN